MSELNYSIYMNQIIVKIYELNMQNTKNFMHNKDMNSLILDRQVGRIMNKLGLFCSTRIAKKIKEFKNTKFRLIT